MSTRNRNLWMHFECLESRKLLTSVPYLIADLNPTIDPIYDDVDQAMVQFGDVYLIAGGDQQTGLELWQSDGTNVGTGLFIDLEPGPASGMSRPANLLAAPNRDFAFFTTDREFSSGLWKTDALNTVRVFPGDVELLNVTGAGAYFVVAGPTQMHNQVWFADGDTDDVTFLRQFGQIGRRGIRTVGEHDGSLLFSVCYDTPRSHCDLWSTSDSQQSMTLLDDQRHHLFSRVENLFGADHVFIGESENEPVALRITPDGLSEPIELVGSPVGSVAGRTLLHNREGIYQMDGVDAEPILIHSPRHPESDFYHADDFVYFLNQSGRRGIGVTDGTAEGTKVLYDPDRSDITVLSVDGNRLTFWDSRNDVIGVTFGTAESTRLQAIELDINLHSLDMVPDESGQLLVRNSVDDGEQIYSIDVNDLSAEFVANIWTGTRSSSVIQVLPTVDDRVAIHFVGSGIEDLIVLTDGDSITTDPFYDAGSWSANDILIQSGDITFFTRRSPSGAREPWLYNAANQTSVRIGENVTGLNGVTVLAATVRDGRFLFAGQRGRFLGVWSTDGTEPGTTRDLSFVGRGEAVAAESGRLFIRARGVNDQNFESDIWYETDGTLDGTIEIDESAVLHATSPFVIDDVRYELREGLWRGKTSREFTLRGETPTRITDAHRMAGDIFFRGQSTTDGESYVYRVNTRTSQVEQYSDLPVESLLGVSNAKLIVTHDDGFHGVELWSIPLRINGDFGRDDSRAYRTFCTSYSGRGPHPAHLDINYDGLLDEGDVDAMVEYLDWTFGDVNFDGVFDSADLVELFQHGRFETGRRARWETGDWNCDGVFDSSDIVKAFAAGSYSHDTSPGLRVGA